ncbi:MAG TPA: hypothetical protein VH458_24830 [Vicinamibacterales bacterium]|jgi:hypothetical protein
MRNRFALGIMIAVLLGLALVMVGGYAYNLGVVQGIAESGRVAAAPGAAPVVRVWPHPWGFGWFPLFPLFFIFALLFLVRGLYWRGAWGCGYGYGYHAHGVPPAFDEWHRRAHEQPAPGSQSRA